MLKVVTCQELNRNLPKLIALVNEKDITLIITRYGKVIGHINKPTQSRIWSYRIHIRDSKAFWKKIERLNKLTL